MSERLDDLFARVYAAPDALDVRLVLADALLEAENPRGELIMLQHARRAGAQPDAPTKRERELLKRHTALWLGRIAPAIVRTQPLVFDLGFVARATFRNNAKGRERIGAPEWSTLEWLDVGHDVGSAAGLLLTEPIRRWLRTAWRVTGEDFEAIATSEHRFAWKEICLAAPFGLLARDAAVRAFETASNLPDVGRLVLSFREWATSYDTPALERILVAPLTRGVGELVFAKGGGLAWDDPMVETVRAHAAVVARRGQRLTFAFRPGRVTLGLEENEGAFVEVDLLAGGGAMLAQLLRRLGGGPWRRLRIVGQTQSAGEVRLLRQTGEALRLEVVVGSGSGSREKATAVP